MHLVGNLCLALAALIHLGPLQHLLWEMTRKKDDGGGAIAGGLILLAMWALLLAGLMLATARGGFDWLSLRRGALYGLVVFATVALGVVTAVSLTSFARPSGLARLAYGWPLYVLPLLTMLYVAVVLNPVLGGRIPPGVWRLPWTVLAGLSLVACAGFCGYKLAALSVRQVRAIPHRLAGDADLARRQLAQVPTLDPERDFADLLGLAGSFNNDAVRALAIARLREHPRLVEALVRELREGRGDRALDLLAHTAFADTDRARLAGPAREAMLAVAEETPAKLRHAPAPRRKAARRHGDRVFKGIAQRFADTGVDFAPALAAWVQAFEPEE